LHCFTLYTRKALSKVAHFFKIYYYKKFKDSISSEFCRIVMLVLLGWPLVAQCSYSVLWNCVHWSKSY